MCQLGLQSHQGKTASKLTLLVDRFHILAPSRLKASVSCWRLSSVPRDHLPFFDARASPTWSLTSWKLTSSKLASKREQVCLQDKVLYNVTLMGVTSTTFAISKVLEANPNLIPGKGITQRQGSWTGHFRICLPHLILCFRHHSIATVL